MSEISQFPKKYEDLVRIAQQSMNEKNFFHAKQLLEQAYEIDSSFETVQLLVLCLLELGKENEALALAKENEQEFLEQKDRATVYFRLLLQQKSFIEVRKLIRQGDFDQEFKDTILNQVEHSEQFMLQFESQRVEEICGLVEHLESKSVMEQLHVMTYLESLPYKSFRDTMKKIFINKLLHPLTRAKALEISVQVAMDETMAFCTFDEKKIEVIPKQLVLPEKQLGYLECLKQIERSSDDPSITTGILQELSFQSAMAYPTFETLIVEPKWWIEQSLLYYRQLLSETPIEGITPLFLKKHQFVTEKMQEMF
ncbi:MAG: hypothetical protein ACK5NA_09920 [Enterococcus sp.]